MTRYFLRFFFQGTNNIQLSHEWEVKQNTGGYITRREVSRYLASTMHRPCVSGDCRVHFHDFVGNSISKYHRPGCLLNFLDLESGPSFEAGGLLHFYHFQREYYVYQCNKTIKLMVITKREDVLTKQGFCKILYRKLRLWGKSPNLGINEFGFRRI